MIYFSSSIKRPSVPPSSLSVCHQSCEVTGVLKASWFHQCVSEHAACLSFRLTRPQEVLYIPKHPNMTEKPNSSKQGFHTNWKCRVQWKYLLYWYNKKCILQLLGALMFCPSKNGYIDVHIWHLHLYFPDSNRLQPWASAKSQTGATQQHTHTQHSWSTASFQLALFVPALSSLLQTRCLITPERDRASSCQHGIWSNYRFMLLNHSDRLM